MYLLKAFFYTRTSFFAMEDGRIASSKTTVTINPQQHQVEIVQENLYSFIQKEKDNEIVNKQWENLSQLTARQIPWSKELDSFSSKTLTILELEAGIQAKINFSYKYYQDLQAMNLWYNEEKNTFFMNSSPEDGIKTDDGELLDNYLVFDADSTFSFSIEALTDVQVKYQQYRIPLEEIIKQ